MPPICFYTKSVIEPCSKLSQNRRGRGLEKCIFILSVYPCFFVVIS